MARRCRGRADRKTAAELASVQIERANVDALTKAREVLARRIADPKLLLMPDLKADLRAILEAFEEIDERTSALAAFALRKHFWPASAVSSSNLRRLMEMGGEAKTASHDQRCICEQCMGHGG